MRILVVILSAACTALVVVTVMMQISILNLEDVYKRQLSAFSDKSVTLSARLEMIENRLRELSDDHAREYTEISNEVNYLSEKLKPIERIEIVGKNKKSLRFIASTP